MVNLLDIIRRFILIKTNLKHDVSETVFCLRHEGKRTTLLGPEIGTSSIDWAQ
jgi:hypothetical protein